VLQLPADKVDELISGSDGIIDFDFSRITDVASVELSASTVQSFKNSGLNVKILLPHGSVNFGSEALSAIVSVIRGNSAVVSVKETNVSDMTTEQQNESGAGAVYEINVYDVMRNDYITDFSGSVEITLPYSPAQEQNPNAIVVYSSAVDGNMGIIANGFYDADTGLVTFTTTHLSDFVIGYNPVEFTDISGHWANDFIVQAGARVLVAGYPDGSYNPDSQVTRAEFAQMVYNVAGLGGAGGFAYADVSENDWYYTAISALKNAYVLQGLDKLDGTFGPNDPMTRAEMAVILGNLAQIKRVKPTSSVTASDFTDFDELGVYAESIVQAVNAGFLNADGMGGGRFAPSEYVTRAQAATIQITVLRALNRVN
jgi:hypothetical protein